MYWAEALAAQDQDAELKAKFATLAKELAANEEKIIAELAAAQGSAADIGGYYAIDAEKTNAVMRPSATFNAALAAAEA
jgi:isocitrate dehydrogenase